MAETGTDEKMPFSHLVPGRPLRLFHRSGFSLLDENGPSHTMVPGSYLTAQAGAKMPPFWKEGFRSDVISYPF